MVSPGKVFVTYSTYADATSPGPYQVAKFNTMGRSVKVRLRFLMSSVSTFVLLLMSASMAIVWSEPHPHIVG